MLFIQVPVTFLGTVEFSPLRDGGYIDQVASCLLCRCSNCAQSFVLWGEYSVRHHVKDLCTRAA